MVGNHLPVCQSSSREAGAPRTAPQALLHESPDSAVVSSLSPPQEQQERVERCKAGTSAPRPPQPQALGVCIPLSRSKYLLGSPFPQPSPQPSWGVFVRL